MRQLRLRKRDANPTARAGMVTISATEAGIVVMYEAGRTAAMAA